MPNEQAYIVAGDNMRRVDNICRHSSEAKQSYAYIVKKKKKKIKK